MNNTLSLLTKPSTAQLQQTSKKEAINKAANNIARLFSPSKQVMVEKKK